MTADHGYFKCSFSGPAEVMEAFRAIEEGTDRQNQFSHGLSWLDDLDRDGEAESEAISYDSIEGTREFLTFLSAALPELQFEGMLEHTWPVLPCKKTVVSFSSHNGTLLWNEGQEDAPEDDFLFDFEDDEDEEVFIPTTP